MQQNKKQNVRKRSKNATIQGKRKSTLYKNQITVDRNGKIRTVTTSVPGKKLFDEKKPSLPEKKELTGDLGYVGAEDIKVPNKKQKGKKLTKKEKQFNKERSDCV